MYKKLKNSKKLISMALCYAILAAMLSVSFMISMPAVYAESPFTDVPESHWAYDNIVELSNAGIVAGMGDGTFAPEETLTKSQMSKLLVYAAGVYDEGIKYNDTFVDVESGEWYAEYIASGLASGMYGTDYERVFAPEDALLRGECVEWVVNVLGADSSDEYTYNDISDSSIAAAASDASAIGVITGYEDGSFRPNDSLTRAEATAIIKRVMDYVESRDGVREDSDMSIELNDDVVIAESSSSVNVPVEADEEECTVSFKNADETLTSLRAGDILYMPPTSAIPDGLVGKVADITNGTYTTIKLEQAAIEEVVKSIDISAYFGVSDNMVGNDGDLELMSASGSELSFSSLASSVSSGDSGVTYDVNSDAGISDISLLDKKIGVYANADATSTLHFETPSYAKKESVYAAVNMTLKTLVDMKMEVSDGEISTLYVKTGVDTDIASTAGYKLKGEKSFSYDLPTIEITIAGIVKVDIKSKLVATATGELTIEANATLSNKIGLEYTLTDKLNTYNTTTADSTLSVNAEGSLKAGPQVDVTLKLCELKLPIKETVIIEGFDIANANFTLGAGASGKLDESLTVSISDTDASISTGSDDELHMCYFCVGGDIFYYYSGKIGLGDDIQKIYKKISGSDDSLTKTLADETKTIGNWHLSTGDGYTNEFEFKACPHIAYKVTVKAVEKDTTPTEAVTGADIKITNDENETKAMTEDDGAYLIYATKGKYTVNAEKDGYKDAEKSMYVYKASEYILEMEPENNGWAYSANIGEIDGVVYATRAVPGMVEFPYGAHVFAEYGDYVYYITKEAGTTDFSTWIYRCDKDFSNPICLVATIVDLGSGGPISFDITDNKLYYDLNSKTHMYVDLETLEIKQGSAPTHYVTIDGKKQSLDSLKAGYVYEYDGAVYYSVSENKSRAIYKVEDGVKTRLVSGSIYFEGGVAGGYIYYSTETWANNSNYAYLYRMPISGGEEQLVDSHETAGSGGYFNY